MKKNYKFDPNNHCSIVDAMVDYAEDFYNEVHSKRWQCKDQLIKYNELKKSFKQFQQFEKVFIEEWNRSEYPFEFWEIDSNVMYLIENILSNGKFDLQLAIETLAYYIHWYSDRMNGSRLYILHTYWLLALNLANEFNETIS